MASAAPTVHRGHRREAVRCCTAPTSPPRPRPLTLRARTVRCRRCRSSSSPRRRCQSPAHGRPRCLLRCPAHSTEATRGAPAAASTAQATWSHRTCRRCHSDYLHSAPRKSCRLAFCLCSQGHVQVCEMRSDVRMGFVVVAVSWCWPPFLTGQARRQILDKVDFNSSFLFAGFSFFFFLLCIVLHKKPFFLCSSALIRFFFDPFFFFPVLFFVRTTISAGGSFFFFFLCRFYPLITFHASTLSPLLSGRQRCSTSQFEPGKIAYYFFSIPFACIEMQRNAEFTRSASSFLLGFKCGLLSPTSFSFFCSPPLFLCLVNGTFFFCYICQLFQLCGIHVLTFYYLFKAKLTEARHHICIPSGSSEMSSGQAMMNRFPTARELWRY